MTDERTQSDRRGWSISKQISLGTVLSILAQSVALIIFIVKMDSRITLLEERRLEDKAALSGIAQLKEKVILTEAQVQALTKTVERMELKMDQQRALDEVKRRK